MTPRSSASSWWPFSVASSRKRLRGSSSTSPTPRSERRARSAAPVASTDPVRHGLLPPNAPPSSRGVPAIVSTRQLSPIVCARHHSAPATAMTRVAATAAHAMRSRAGRRQTCAPRRSRSRPGSTSSAPPAGARSQSGGVSRWRSGASRDSSAATSSSGSPPRSHRYCSRSGSSRSRLTSVLLPPADRARQPLRRRARAATASSRGRG